MIDRFTRGYVVDFCISKLIDFPIFNVADCYVTVSMFLFILLFLFLYKRGFELPVRPEGKGSGLKQQFTVERRTKSHPY